MDPVRHLRFSVAALASIIGLGTLGYTLIEGWQAFDALYMTVITLARRYPRVMSYGGMRTWCWRSGQGSKCL